MASCKDCLSYGVCNEHWLGTGNMPNLCSAEIICEHFKDRNRFVELPCKVGDKLFIIYDDGYEEYECSEFSIGVLQELRIFAKCGISGYQNIQECSEHYCGQPFCSTSFVSQDFGKTVFLTREEAERALKNENRIIEVDGSVPNKATVCDMQEVRHGKNITKIHPTDEFICSECGYMNEDCIEKKYSKDGDYYYLCEYEYKYCPNCGAKMDKE